MRPLLPGLSLAGMMCVGLSAAEPVTFLRDVAPILNKAGCTSGPCHGAAKGKNGFKLSLRGYDPQFDYEALLYDLSGRRFNRAEPARSLMLARPAQQVPHGGGLRFEKDSAYLKIIENWIAQGVPYGDAAKDAVASLEVEPTEVRMPKPGETVQIKVRAKFADGQTRDVTKEATVESNVTDLAKVDAAAAKVSGERIGEATLLVRYQGKDPHEQILAYLQTKYGPLDRTPGQISVGPIRVYAWHGFDTEITLRYESRIERGVIFFESRILREKLSEGNSGTVF